MRRIYKYKLNTTDMQTLYIPNLIGEANFKSQVLKVDMENETPHIWCLVDSEEAEQEIKIRIVGTDNPMPLLSKDDDLGNYMLNNGTLVPLLSKDDYLGSYKLNSGTLVFHVFIDR